MLENELLILESEFLILENEFLILENRTYFLILENDFVKLKNSSDSRGSRGVNGVLILWNISPKDLHL